MGIFAIKTWHERLNLGSKKGRGHHGLRAVFDGLLAVYMIGLSVFVMIRALRMRSVLEEAFYGLDAAVNSTSMGSATMIKAMFDQAHAHTFARARMRVAYTRGQVHSVESIMSWGFVQNWLTFSGMLLLILRIMVATHCHPRLSFLTGALTYAANDLMQFALLFALVYSS